MAEDFYDPYMPEIKTDPYPIYRRMRAERPVYYLERFNAWALAKFEDIWEASQDPEHYTTANSTADRALLEGKPAAMQTLNSTDPPRHLEMRKKLFKYFGPSNARRLEPDIRKWTTDYLDQYTDVGKIDAVQQLGQQIAVRIACIVSGFPLADTDYLVDVVARFFRRESGTEGMSPEGHKAQVEMWDYLEGIAKSSRGTEQNNALGIFNAEQDELGPFTPERVAQQLTLLLVGATETFPKVFATGLLRLWQHPEQRQYLVDNPDYIPIAMDEILRYDMPTQWLGRTVTKAHEIRGQKLEPGQPIIFLYPSGNRDEEEFENPDTFDIFRKPERHLTFGHGIHRCLGSFFARMEGKVLFEEVLRRFPDYEVLEDECEFPPTEFVQGYSKFTIAFND